MLLGKKNQRLSAKEEMQLFLKIKLANNLPSVDKEMTLLYNSLCSGLWGKLRQDFHGYIPPRMIEDLENSFQEGWFKVIMNRHTFDPQKAKNLYNWVYTIILNTTKDTFLNPQKSILLPKDGNKNNPDDNEGIFPSPEITCNSNIILSIIEEAIDNILTQREQEVFNYRVKQELSYKEICDKLGIGLGAINKHLNKACNKIRINLEQQGINLNTI